MIMEKMYFDDINEVNKKIIQNKINLNKMRMRENNKIIASRKAREHNIPLRKAYRYVLEYNMLEKHELNRISSEYKQYMKDHGIERLDLVDAYHYIRDSMEDGFYSEFKIDNYVRQRAETDEILKELRQMDGFAATEFTSAFRNVVYRGIVPAQEVSAQMLLPSKYHQGISDIGMS